MRCFLALSLLALFLASCAKTGKEPSVPSSNTSQILNKEDAYGHFLMARILENNGQLLEADALYEKVLEADSEAVAVRKILMDHYFSRGQAEHALKEAKALSAYDSSADFSLLYAQLLYRNKEVKEALRIVNRSEERNENPYLLELSGLIYEQLGDTLSAQKVWENLADKKPEEMAVQERLISLYIGMQRWDKALATIRGYSAKTKVYSSSFRLSLFRFIEATQSSDSILPVITSMAGTLSGKERHALIRDLAHLEIRKGHADKAESLFCALSIETGSFQDRRALGLFFAARGKASAAESLLVPVVAEKAESETAYYLGASLLAQGKHKEAELAFRTALQLDSLNPVIWMNLGVAMLRAGKYDSAEAVFIRTERIAPEEGEAFFLHGLACNSMQSFSKAATAFREAWTKDTTHLEALFQWGASLERSGKVPFGEPESLLLEVLKRNPDHHSAMNYLAYSYVIRNVKIALADSLLTKALKLSPENPAYLDSYGWLLFKTGKFQEAYGFLERALKLNKEDDPEILEHLALASETLGQLETSKEWWQRLLKLNPNHLVAKEKLK